MCLCLDRRYWCEAVCALPELQRCQFECLRSTAKWIQFSLRCWKLLCCLSWIDSRVCSTMYDKWRVLVQWNQMCSGINLSYNFTNWVD
jgi:hypothetical protein